MFKKKDKVKADSVADIQLRRLIDCYYTAFDLLRNKTEQAIVSNGVIELYPSGSPDRKRAELDCVKAKCAMVEAISAFDNAKANYNKFFRDHYEELVNAREYHRIEKNSHNVVEEVWERFFKQR